MTKQVIKAALEAMCCMRDMVAHPDNLAFVDKHISVLQAALAEPDRLEGIEAIEKDAGIHVSQQTEPEQEPMAWVEPKWLDPDTRGWPSDSFASQPIEGWLPLYTAPTLRKPQTTHWEGCEAVHPECKEKNT